MKTEFDNTENEALSIARVTGSDGSLMVTMEN